MEAKDITKAKERWWIGTKYDLPDMEDNVESYLEAWYSKVQAGWV